MAAWFSALNLCSSPYNVGEPCPEEAETKEEDEESDGVEVALGCAASPSDDGPIAVAVVVAVAARTGVGDSTGLSRGGLPGARACCSGLDGVRPARGGSPASSLPLSFLLRKDEFLRATPAAARAPAMGCSSSSWMGELHNELLGSLDVIRTIDGLREEAASPPGSSASSYSSESSSRSMVDMPMVVPRSSWSSLRDRTCLDEPLRTIARSA